MNKHFTLTHKNETIQVERSHKSTYILKYPDFKFIELDNNENGWVVEDRSGDYWTDEEIETLGAQIREHEPAIEEVDNDSNDSGLPGFE